MLSRVPASPGHRTLVFTLPADPELGTVSVVGNFNDWTPGATPLTPGDDGLLTASVTLRSNYTACFRYLGANDHWFDEPEADFIDSGASVVLGIEEPAPAPAETTPPAAERPGKPATKAGKAAAKAEKKAARKIRKLRLPDAIDEVRRLSDKAQRKADKLARRLASRPSDERLNGGAS